jgi:hypothetical protein
MRPGTPGLLPAEDEWWKLPSGRTVVVRRIESVEGCVEAIVRYVDESGAKSLGEFNLTLAFIARGRKVGHD